MVDLRAPLGNSPAALAELFTNDIAPLQGAPPAPSSGAAVASSMSQPPGTKELRRMSTDSGPLSLSSPRAQQQGRRRRASTPQLRSFRTFMRDREAIHRSESSARLKVRYVRLPCPLGLLRAGMCSLSYAVSVCGAGGDIRHTICGDTVDCSLCISRKLCSGSTGGAQRLLFYSRSDVASLAVF